MTTTTVTVAIRAPGNTVTVEVEEPEDYTDFAGAVPDDRVVRAMVQTAVSRAMAAYSFPEVR